ncbi:MAG: hypothetical protein RBT49_15100 [Bacteroidales bacterium]|jgi:hypothetical protein|nr:hypothetical protein [Bacteroidales bacterium]
MKTTQLMILIYLFIGTLTFIFPSIFEVLKEGFKSFVNFKRNFFEGIIGIILVLILLSLYLSIYPFLFIFILFIRLGHDKPDKKIKVKTIKIIDEVYNRVIEEKDVKVLSNKLVEIRRYKYNELSKVIKIEHFDENEKLKSIRNLYYNLDGKKIGEMVDYKLTKTKTQNFYIFDELGREIKSYGEFDNHKFYNEFSYNKNGEKINHLTASLVQESNLLESFKNDVEKQSQLF